jgi:hypothetical protein
MDATAAPPDTKPEGWLDEEELVAATGVNHWNLVRWRGKGLIVKPINPRLGFAIGTASYYPPIAVPMIKRLGELRQITRNPDEWLWRLWLEDFPADIRLWTDERLAAEQEKLAPIQNDRDLETVVAGIPTPGRNDPHRLIYKPFTRTSDRHKEDHPKSLMLWAAAVATGIDLPASLYDPTPPLLKILKKVGDLPDDMPPPDDDLHVEQMSLAFLRKILASVKNETEIERSRSDWKLISGLAERANVIDWDGLKGSLPRHVRRILRKRRLPPPPPAVDYFIACWRDFTARAVLLPFLIFIRRSPDHSQKLSYNLALAALAASRAGRQRQQLKGEAELHSLEPQP